MYHTMSLNHLPLTCLVCTPVSFQLPCLHFSLAESVHAAGCPVLPVLRSLWSQGGQRNTKDSTGCWVKRICLAGYPQASAPHFNSQVDPHHLSFTTSLPEFLTANISTLWPESGSPESLHSLCFPFGGFSIKLKRMAERQKLFPKLPVSSDPI